MAISNKKAGRYNSSPDGMKRTKRAALNVTPIEFEALNEAANSVGLSRTEYILQSTIYATGEDITSRFNEAKKIIDELNEIKSLNRAESRNLNQIARGINDAIANGRDNELVEGAQNVEKLIANNSEIFIRIMAVLKDIPNVLKQERRFKNDNSKEQENLS